MTNRITILSTFLLLFIIVFDPTNVVLGIKNYCFVFFIICNWKNISGKYIIIPIIFLMSFFVSWSVAFLFDIKTDLSITIWNIKSFLFLAILLFTSNKKLFFLSLFYKVTLWLSIFVCVLTFGILTLGEPIKTSFEQIIRALDGFYMYGYRDFYSIKYFVLFYRTSSMCVISLGTALICLFKSKHPKYFIHSLIFTLALFFSGTRANILSCFLMILGVYFFHILFNKKCIGFAIFIFEVLFLFGLFLIYLLLNQGDNSSGIKQNHLQSFWNYFKTLPLPVLLYGSGAGAIFFSVGRNEFTSLTELSYMELLKNYGFLQTIFLLGCIGFPFIKIARSKFYSRFEKLSFIWSYLAYLFIAGTNPLLIGSTGLTTIACMFYICDKDALNEFLPRKSSISIKNLRFFSIKISRLFFARNF